MQKNISYNINRNKNKRGPRWLRLARIEASLKQQTIDILQHSINTFEVLPVIYDCNVCGSTEYTYFECSSSNLQLTDEICIE